MCSSGVNVGRPKQSVGSYLCNIGRLSQTQIINKTHREGTESLMICVWPALPYPISLLLCHVPSFLFLVFSCLKGSQEKGKERGKQRINKRSEKETSRPYWASSFKSCPSLRFASVKETEGKGITDIKGKPNMNGTKGAIKEYLMSAHLQENFSSTLPKKPAGKTWLAATRYFSLSLWPLFKEIK